MLGEVRYRADVRPVTCAKGDTSLMGILRSQQGRDDSREYRQVWREGSSTDVSSVCGDFAVIFFWWWWEEGGGSASTPTPFRFFVSVEVVVVCRLLKGKGIYVSKSCLYSFSYSCCFRRMLGESCMVN